jgi:lipid A 3-O-deacylase
MVGLMLLASAPLAAAADGQLGVWAGRSSESPETDVARLNYRHPLGSEARAWWWPQQVQLGVGVWSIPGLGGRSQRFDASVTPIWRGENAFGYIEGGIGVYLLSKTINNQTTRLPSSLEFGSHLGAGLRSDKVSVGLAFQHISNAGIKEPNGGINFYFITVSVPL